MCKRGDIYYVNFGEKDGSKQGGVRPVLIIQNDIGNRHSPTVICAAITSRMNKAKLPTHIQIEASACGYGHSAVGKGVEKEVSSAPCADSAEEKQRSE